jgi:hypothetical protein
MFPVSGVSAKTSTKAYSKPRSEAEVLGSVDNGSSYNVTFEVQQAMQVPCCCCFSSAVIEFISNADDLQFVPHSHRKDLWLPLLSPRMCRGVAMSESK